MSSNNVRMEAEKDSSSDRERSTMDSQLQQVLTNTMSVSPEIFEKLYLNPKSNVKGDLRKTFANPTPIALVGFVVGLTPLSAEFIGWRGAGGNAVATTTATIFFGGVLLTIGGLLEFILGNTFPCVVFLGYGAHFFTFGMTFVPWFNAVGYYTDSGEGSPTDLQPQFLASYAYYTLSLGLLSFVYLVGSIRTNLVFVFIFVFATLGFGFATGGFWHLSVGNMALGNRLLVGTGSCFWGASMLGWYLLLAIMMQTMELPFPDLPVFDLSTVVKAKKRRVKEE